MEDGKLIEKRSMERIYAVLRLCVSRSDRKTGNAVCQTREETTFVREDFARALNRRVMQRPRASFRRVARPFCVNRVSKGFAENHSAHLAPPIQPLIERARVACDEKIAA